MFLGGIETLKFNNFGFDVKEEGMEYYFNPGLVEYRDIVPTFVQSRSVPS